MKGLIGLQKSLVWISAMGMGVAALPGVYACDVDALNIKEIKPGNMAYTGAGVTGRVLALSASLNQNANSFKINFDDLSGIASLVTIAHNPALGVKLKEGEKINGDQENHLNTSEVSRLKFLARFFKIACKNKSFLEESRPPLTDSACLEKFAPAGLGKFTPTQIANLIAPYVRKNNDYVYPFGSNLTNKPFCELSPTPLVTYIDSNNVKNVAEKVSCQDPRGADFVYTRIVNASIAGTTLDGKDIKGFKTDMCFVGQNAVMAIQNTAEFGGTLLRGAEEKPKDDPITKIGPCNVDQLALRDSKTRTCMVSLNVPKDMDFWKTMDETLATILPESGGAGEHAAVESVAEGR